MTPILALPIFLAIMARSSYLRLDNPAVERPAQIVGVLSITGVVVSLGMIVGADFRIIH